MSVETSNHFGQALFPSAAEFRQEEILDKLSDLNSKYQSQYGG